MPSLEGEYENLWNEKWSWSPEQEDAITDMLNEGFYVIDHIRKGAILFVGVNPSVLKGNGGLKNQMGDFANIPYFEPFRNISDECGFDGEFSVADLFAIRCTTQKTLENLLEKDRSFENFCKKQFELFLKIMRQAEPCVIVVCNAYASGWMKKTLKSDTLHFDDTIGTYRISMEDMNNVPIFFSSMLSGQRALDIFSRERLVWQIKHYLKNPRK